MSLMSIVILLKETKYLVYYILITYFYDYENYLKNLCRNKLFCHFMCSILGHNLRLEVVGLQGGWVRG